MKTGETAERSRDEILFGPFSLAVGERMLKRDGIPVELGARALDILVVLISSPNQVVGKKALLAQVWPDITVEEGSLRFHVASLRKALGDGKAGARYITTIAGRGYCFVAPISSASAKLKNKTGAEDPSPNAAFLPPRVQRMVGRGDGVQALSTQLVTSRFVTIVGPGGVGKTTLAVAVAHELLENFVGSVLFVDLCMSNDPGMVGASLASLLGISVRSDDPMPSVIAFLRAKRLLLVFDNCEHVVEAAAIVTAQIFRAAPQVHVLATSREALRAEGERVYRLEPLKVPPEDSPLTADVVLTYSAIQLFVERAIAFGAQFELRDLEAAVVTGICRRLDGVALAIELAAGRVEALGLLQTASLLDQRLSLLWQGQRTAPPRQKTLQATLDWSYGLLSSRERTVLHYLAMFIGHFSVESTIAIMESTAIDNANIFETIESLVNKSMVAARTAGATMRYRLLDTTRAYVLAVAADKAEFSFLPRHHAAYCQKWLAQTGSEWPTLSNVAQRAPYLAGLGNVRSALEWCFGDGGDTRLGVALAAAAAPVFSAMSMLTECLRWTERAIEALDEASYGGYEEMHLQAALGLSLMFTRGSTDAARSALKRSLSIAEERSDPLNQLQLLAPLTMYHLRIGDFRTALTFGERAAALSTIIVDPGAKILAHSISGIALTHTDNLAGARSELEAALLRLSGSQNRDAIYLGFDGHDMAGVFLAKTLWLQGFPDQAMARAHQTVKDAASIDHPVTLSIALVWAISFFLWVGDLDAAERLLNWFIERAETHSLGPYVAVGRGYRGHLAIRRGEAKEGVEKLQSALEELHVARYELQTTAFSIWLAQGLSATGRHAESSLLIDEAIATVRANGDVLYMPELLRIKAQVNLSGPTPRFENAEAFLAQAIDLSRLQAAPAWELRCAIDLARLRASQGKSDARSLLQRVYVRFAEGFDTPDLKSAAHLLATLP